MNGAGALTGSSLAVIFIVLAFYFWKRKIWPRTQIVFGLLASLGLAGAYGRLTDWLGEQMGRTTTSATAALFGVGVPLAFLVVMGIALFLALKPKGPGPTKWSFLIALLFFPLAFAVGGIGSDIGGAAQDAYAQFVPVAAEGFSSAIASLRK